MTKLLSYIHFCKEMLLGLFSKSLSPRLILTHMQSIGYESLGVIILAAIMIGAVFGIQFGKIFRIFGVESMVGAAASFALTKELAPVVTSFLVTGRNGSSMSAEISNMRVAEQIDSMQIMSVSPVAYLVTPRVLASILMMPLLTGIFILVGIISAYVMTVILFNVDQGVFINQILWISTPKHVIEGLQKSLVFGFIYSTISCFKGFYASGGAQGVGRATTEAVVVSLVTILIFDFFISYIQMRVLF